MRTMDNNRRNPPGILLIRSIRGKDWSINTYRYVVLLVTFIAYTAYHASRKPSSIVKSVLDPDPSANSTEFSPWPVGDVFIERERMVTSSSLDENDLKKGKGWAPFNRKDGTSKLARLMWHFLHVIRLE
ncbi:UNVERIFIED_CONTAM: putative glycerol-3-phosphate transporter 4, partial [Sesamum radiatum]